MTGNAAQSINQNAVVSVLANEHRELMVARREAEIDRQVKLMTNPMSKRALDQALSLLARVANIKSVLMWGSSVMVATVNNLDNVNRSLGLVLSAIQEVEDRCTSDKAKHLVAHKSNYGWKFVRSLEALEKTVGHIDVSTLRAQEKAYAMHIAAVGGDSKWSDSDWLDGGSGSGPGSSGTRGKNYQKNKNRKENLKAKKGKGKEHQVNKSGNVSKPPKKGCYRCTGNHRVDKCPYPPVNPTEYACVE